jgi:hypothetical protein
MFEIKAQQSESGRFLHMSDKFLAVNAGQRLRCGAQF